MPIMDTADRITMLEAQIEAYQSTINEMRMNMNTLIQTIKTKSLNNNSIKTKQNRLKPTSSPKTTTKNQSIASLKIKSNDEIQAPNSINVNNQITNISSNQFVNIPNISSNQTTNITNISSNQTISSNKSVNNPNISSNQTTNITNISSNQTVNNVKSTTQYVSKTQHTTPNINTITTNTKKMSDSENPAKRTKFDFTKSATMISLRTTNTILNEFINIIGIHNLEYEPNISEDKPFQLSMIFKHRNTRNEMIENCNKTANAQIMMSKDYVINDYAIQTNCLTSNILKIIELMIANRNSIESYLISKPSEGKFYIKINGKDENTQKELLQVIPGSTTYQSREMLAITNALNVSIPLNPKFYTKEQAISVVEELCKSAKITFHPNNVKITLKDKIITRSSGETNTIHLMRAHYSTITEKERDAILKQNILVQTEKKKYLRSMKSTADFYKNPPIRTTYNNTYNNTTTPIITQQDSQRVIALEGRMNIVEESVKDLGQNIQELKLAMTAGFEDIKRLIAGTQDDDSENELDEDEEMVNDSSTKN